MEGCADSLHWDIAVRIAVQKHFQALAQVAQLYTAGNILFRKHVSHQSED